MPTDQWMDVEGIKTIYTTTDKRRFDLRMIYASLKEIGKYDVMHLNSLYYRPSFIIALIGLLRGKRIIWSVRGELSGAACNTGFKRGYIKMLRLLFRRKITFHITSEQELADTVSQLSPTKEIISLPNYMTLPTVYDVKDSYNGDLLYIG